MDHYTAQSFWVSKKKGSIETESLKNTLDRDELLIKTFYTGISYGTEKIVFDSQVPSNQFKFMKAPHQEGSFNTRVKYGYLNVGKVIKGSKDFLDKMVYTMYPHQSKYIIDSSLVTIIPETVPVRRALLTANMETAINAMWDSKPSIGDKVYVIGAGIVGLLMAYVLSKTFGIQIIIIDKDVKKRSLCNRLGITFEDNTDNIKNADIIYECSGNITALEQIFDYTDLDTKVCVLSWYGKQQSKINMGENCFSRRLNIIFSQVGNMASYKLRKFDNLKRRSLALSMLDDNNLDLLLDSNEITLKDLPNFFEEEYTKGLCKVVRY